MNSTGTGSSALVAATIAMALLSACAGTPVADRPQPAQSARYTAETLQLESATQPPDAQHLALGDELSRDWWQLFGSTTIDAVVRRAIAGNRDVAAAAVDLQQARDLTAAQSESVGPQAELTAGSGRQKYGKQFLGSLANIPPFSYFSVGMDISNTTDFGHTSAQRIEQRRAQADFEQQQLRAAWLSVSGSAVSQFIQAAAARSQIATLQALLLQDRQYLDLLAEARSAGSVTQTEIAEAEAKLATDAARLPPLRQQLDTAHNALAVLQGQAPAAATPPDANLDAVSLPHQLPVTLPSELAHRRPDILAAESQLRAAVANVGIAHAAFYPHLTLTASTGLQATEAGQLFDHASGVFGLTGSFVAPLLNRGALKAQQNAAVAAMHGSAARYEQTVLQAFGQVADALQALEHDAELITAATQSQTAESARVELLRTAREQGSGGILPLLEATRRQHLAGLDVQRARAQQLQDTVRLFVALGGSKPE
jgi:NodT family efflux transporter outer membrane factor (OMF) lipoprotein